MPIDFCSVPQVNRQDGSIVSDRKSPKCCQSIHSLHSALLGFPRQGVNRDLKKATEAYWGGKLSQKELLDEGKRLRSAHWRLQKSAGVDIIPSNDFSYYDHVLDLSQTFGVSHCDYTAVASSTDRVQRSFLRSIQNTSLTPLMNSSPWEEVCRSLKHLKVPQSMFLHWCVTMHLPCYIRLTSQ